jgi:hypothetical protein
MKDCIFYENKKCVTEALPNEMCIKDCPYYTQSTIYSVVVNGELKNIKAINRDHLKEKIENLFGDVNFFLENEP